MRPVGRAAFAVLSALERGAPSDFIFPGGGKEGHFVGLPKVFSKVAIGAGIDDLTVHGLRHWFASAAASMGMSELTIAGLLGHAVKGVTARYANVPDSTLVAAADRVSARLAQGLEGKLDEDDNVIALSARKMPPLGNASGS